MYTYIRIIIIIIVYGLTLPCTIMLSGSTGGGTTAS